MSSLSERLEAARAKSDIIPPKAAPEVPETAESDVAESAASARLAEGLVAVKARAVETLFERIGVRINDSSLTEEQLRRFVRQELSRIVDEEQLSLTSDERKRLIQDIEDDALGLGPLHRLLADSGVTEIMVNGHNHIYVERNGRIKLSGFRFNSEEHL